MKHQLIKLKGNHYILVEDTANLVLNDFVYQKGKLVKVVSDVEKWKKKKVQRITHSTYPLETVQEEGFTHWGNTGYLYAPTIDLLISDDDVSHKIWEDTYKKVFKIVSKTFTNSYYILDRSELVRQHPMLIQKYSFIYYTRYIFNCLIRFKNPIPKTKWDCTFINGELKLI
jgi:hypothetical protein